MDEIDALLDALLHAAIDGDFEAAIFLQMFAPWAVSQVSKPDVSTERRLAGKRSTIDFG